MNLSMRPYESDEDYWRIRAFLRHVMLLNGVREKSWPVARFDYWRWHGILNLGDGDAELAARSQASWRALHWDGPGEGRQGYTWYRSLQRCPLYRRDLDIIAVAPTGDIASFATAWYDDVTRSAYFEPVGTVPGHVRRGLARAVMSEAMRRLQLLGALARGYFIVSTSLDLTTRSRDTFGTLGAM